ncbi:MAG: hypothetical protein A2V57_02770 [Candidatus Aminicenantes bacterium RBG_19FT_COMBO_65_30]|nr:MAG: hypothetical protein A2V57_02770 [Candidatus Aminicenantes bacterium RBG_19FT_COMBO_65_30]
MNERVTLNLNLATRPLRNRRFYAAVLWALALFIVVLAALTAFDILKYGGEAARLKSSSAEMRILQGEAEIEEKRLTADIQREEGLSRTRVDLVNGIILRKTFLWTALFSELEQALPGPSYITTLSPGFTTDSAITMRMSVTSRSLDDLLAFITDLTARGFKHIQVGGETRSQEGRLIAEITLSYERVL